MSPAKSISIILSISKSIPSGILTKLLPSSSSRYKAASMAIGMATLISFKLDKSSTINFKVSVSSFIKFSKENPFSRKDSDLAKALATSSSSSLNLMFVLFTSKENKLSNK